MVCVLTALVQALLLYLALLNLYKHCKRTCKLSIPTNFFSEDHLFQLQCSKCNNPSLNKIQKFNYLQAQLHNDASRAIADLPLIDTNYDHAIALLTKRYGQSHKVVHAHMKALEILIFNSIMSDVQTLSGALTLSANLIQFWSLFIVCILCLYSRMFSHCECTVGSLNHPVALPCGNTYL